MRKHIVTGIAALGLAISVVAAAGGPASAATRDSDRDGMPNSWEIKHNLNPRKANAKADADGDRINNILEYRKGLNPRNARDAGRDFDRDGLTNLQEIRLHGNLRDEDTDNDGQDDGDERLTLTLVNKADSDGDGLVDGDEDHDGDGISNEDEDDARESCGRDDDDVDGDDISDEDENELGLAVRVADSDGDGVLDGDEDADNDGALNEDEDDDDADRCSGDFDGDGEADEDAGDLFGTIASFDSATGVLVVTTTAGADFTGVVTADTELEFDDEREDSENTGDEELEPTTADLVSGAVVSELELDNETGTLEEIELG
jgi:hypothetical protein